VDQAHLDDYKNSGHDRSNMWHAQSAGDGAERIAREYRAESGLDADTLVQAGLRQGGQAWAYRVVNLAA
jgi:hypothetical protein